MGYVRFEKIRATFPSDAIRYTLSRWPALCHFLDDGRIELDNNSVERAIRPVATSHSLCTPSSSIWEHRNLIFGIRATRSTVSPDRGGDPIVLEVAGTDLVISRGRGRNDDGQFYVRYCFGDPAHSDAFRDRFGGERLTAKPS